MSRPRYSSQEDYDRKEDVIDRMIESLGLDDVRENRDSREYREWDYLYGDTVILIRSRFIKWGQYPTMDTNKSKWDNLLKCPSALLVIYTTKDDQIHWCKVSRVDGEYPRTGGRTDRNDPKDIEPLICIPLNQFNLLEEK